MAGAPALAALHGRIAHYYTGKIERHGPTPAGVDWPEARSQELRFAQLLRVCDFDVRFSLADIGCGYGALLGYVERTRPHALIDYLGVDVSQAMIDAAKKLWRDKQHAEFQLGSGSPRRVDYSVASGIFNVRIDEPMRLWQRFVAETLRAMAATSRNGFAVNFLRPLPRGTDTVPELYRPAPARWADFCEAELGCRVELVADYGLGEVTLLARH